jgi:hypothetical protein
VRNPNYDTYLTAATQLQRWRDFTSHLVAYVVVNLAFMGIWWLEGGGTFWPVYPLVGWGIGLSFQHFGEILRGQITDHDVRRAMNPDVRVD